MAPTDLTDHARNAVYVAVGLGVIAARNVDDAVRQLLDTLEQRAGQGRDRFDMFGPRNLGDQQCVTRHFGKGQTIVAPPFGFQCVDPHDARPTPEINCAQRFGNKRAGAGLFLGGHRIFQIKDDRIGRQIAGFFNRSAIGAGNIKDRAIGARPLKDHSRHTGGKPKFAAAQK
jgi:hypothetical protein